jgi:peptidoglycan/xylan/chitin deacetylase (PgdA/CDA1 family)
MGDFDSKSRSLSIAEWTGVASFLAAILLLFQDVRLSVIPLAGFLLLCVVAPFFPRSSFFLTTITRGKSGKRAVALTFDDGPDPKTTPELLQLLQKHAATATFFVTGEKASDHPGLVREILLHGHSIGNHTYDHDHLVLLRSSKLLTKEIQSTQDVLGEFGITPLAFRSPAGITNPKLRQVLKKTGLYNVAYSCRAVDGGNRWIGNLSKRILRRIRPDDIILLHDIRPKKDGLFRYWLNEVELVLSGIEEKGLTVLPLSDIIKRPVMIPKTGPRSSFADGDRTSIA